MAESQLNILCVLFRTPIAEAATLRSLNRNLASLAGATITLWDNSPSAERKLLADELIQQWSEHGVQGCYVECVQNASLASVYENAIAQAARTASGTLLLLDQDSELDASFVQRLKTAMLRHGRDSFFVPYVYARDRLISPARMFLWFGWLVSPAAPGVVRSRNVSCINSGATIPARRLVENSFRYPAGLRNYGTDVFIFRFAQAARIPIVQFDGHITHDLTFDKLNPDNDRYLRAYGEVMQAFRILFDKGPVTKSLLFCYQLYKGIIMSVRRRDGRFMFTSFGNSGPGSK